MTDFPEETVPDWPVFYTNIERWVELTGRLPSYASTARGITGSMYCPVIVRSPFTVKKLYALNGATLGGAVQMALYASADISPRATYGPEPEGQVVKSGIVAQAGISTWQAFDIPDTKIGAGLYFLCWGNDTTTATVQQLFVVTGANLAESSMGGICHGGGFPINSDFTSAYWSRVVPILAMGGVA